MVVNIITLGCSKNLVDSEYLLRQFHTSGHSVFYDQPDIESDVVIVNTCGFILDAKEESINHILHFVKQKREGKVKKLIVMGCLSERYKNDLQREIPEIDGLFGVWDHEKIVQSIDSPYYPELKNDRLITTPPHFAFLKVSEGCNRNCSFCAIPIIRGKQRSRSIEDLMEEAENLAGRGVRELIIIAQDLTNYGIDLTGTRDLPDLINNLSSIKEIDWIRLHYAYPTGFPEEVISIMATNPKVCNYLDIPIQHISDRILSAMNRGHNRRKLQNLLTKFREAIPDVAIRTTILVGFPGETESEFLELLDFVTDFRFDRLGVFPYSHEEDTPAARLSDDVPDEIKQERAARIMAIQQQISLEINQKKIGNKYKVIIDSVESDYYIGRTEHDSPEVDNEVLIDKSVPLVIGEFYPVLITDAGEFDLFGKVVL